MSLHYLVKTWTAYIYIFIHQNGSIKRKKRKKYMAQQYMKKYTINKNGSRNRNKQ